MGTITELPKDGAGLLDGLKSLFNVAAARYVQTKLPSLEEQYAAQAAQASIQANTETIRAQNQAYLSGMGVSANTLFIGAGVIGIAVLYLLTRK